MDVVIAVEDPRGDDVLALLERHLAFARSVTPHGSVHALDRDGLAAPSVTFFAARRDGVLLGVGALQHVDDTHVEIKSMHTSAWARRQGVARAVLHHLLAVAVARGYRRASLETGSSDAFAPARAMYADAGFVSCEPFGDYTDDPNSVYLTLELDPGSDTTDE